ncbi:uncharacterized protein LOC109723385 isoform X2 [Ananas comosus]|nr:uncharacterized protein LOC109723385 isoform X2 [Ananas comosus]
MDLDSLQPLLRRYIGFLESDGLPSKLETLRPRVQLERGNVWLGIKTLLGFLEAPAFEDGILERYPSFLNIILNHVSDDTSEFSYAVSCLKASFEMLGCKLWLRTTLSPSVIRNTLLGHCFHIRDEKSHKEIFDLFLPFLQSLEALQDGEHEKQRRNIIYFLLHQVSHSSNFSALMRKNACKIALLIVYRGYTMNPPAPPSECAHMWGPSLVSSLMDSSLHCSLRQPAFDLINIIIISDASAMISFKLKYQNTSDIDARNLADPFDDEDELPFSHEIEEKDNCCWSGFSMQNKVASRECKDWICIPLLWFDSMIRMDLLMLPISFSKVAFWALSHISILESGSTAEYSLSLEAWLSSNAAEISSSLAWQVPNSSDDGGEGRESRNSLKVSSMCNVLIKVFKRFATHYIMQIEKYELRKQWTWEPRMSESLILLLIDPNDCIRQADRGILEHVSKSRGLTSGLQFLCSSASSLSALFLGLRYALRLVQADQLLAKFQSLHHLFFVVRKLLKDVVTSQQSPVDIKEASQPVKSLSEGGFLRQPNSNYVPVRQPESSANIVDFNSWEKFSYLLSAITLPFLLKCLKDGMDLANSKHCQMTSVRLLELLPVVYERLAVYASKQSGNADTMLVDILDLKWLSDLVDWGRSSLIVITRHWKQCMFALLETLKGSPIGTVPHSIDSIKAIISNDVVMIDDLKERVSNIRISVSKEASGRVECRVLTEKRSSYKSSLTKGSMTSERSTYSSPFLHNEPALPAHKIREEGVILLSDDEGEEKTPVTLSSSSTSLSRERLEPFPSGTFLEGATCASFKAESTDSRSSINPVDMGKGLHKSGNESYTTVSLKKFVEQGASCASSKAESTDNGTIIPSLGGIDTDKGLRKSANESNAAVSFKKTKSSDKSIHNQLSAKTPSSEVDKDSSVIKEVICEEKDNADPLEHALNSSWRPQLMLTKPKASAPKRQAIQLQLPTRNKSGSLGKMDACTRRLKPPKLDIWYRDILEMDYFAVVGLSTDDGNKSKDSTNLKEVPLFFHSESHYVDIFRPLVLEEFKAQLHNSYIETSLDDMACGSLCVISVERIDDFFLVRGRIDDTESAASRGCVESDLILLTKVPLKNSAQTVHVLGKVERREKSDKNRSLILIIRFYLSNDSPRLNKMRRLLTERSKWFMSRVMSLTPNLREFQALSSLHDIPMLPVILNPVNSSSGYPESRKVQLGKLSQPMQKVLMSSFNDSQLQAISIAIGTLESSKGFELSLIQGPPGTGKTRTIVAIVSALLALPSVQRKHTSKFLSSDPKPSNVGSTNMRAKISQSAAIARAWQDAAFAKQMVRDSEKDFVGPIDRLSKGRVLVCAQSNAAVDELVSRLREGLYGNDGKSYKPYIVRVGNAKTVHPSSLPFFIDTLVEQRLAEEVENSKEPNKDTDVESSSSLRAKLEKVVDSIRSYEAKRAKLKDSDASGNVSLDDRPHKEDDMSELSDEAIRVKLNILYGQKKALCGELAVAQAREKKLAEENKSLKYKVRKSILKEAEIVVTTLSGCGGDLYGVCSESASDNRFGNFSEQTLFDVVVIDEAAQALEPATLIPLQLLKSNGTRCIMVGDPKQLPATVLSNVASKFLYECSMFERLQKAGHPVIMLTEQYRMHPEICRFPSMHFYENKLLNGAQMVSKSAPFHEHCLLGPYMFFDIVDGHECYGKNAGFQSLFNECEADAAVEILKFLKKRYPLEFTNKRIGIVTPYRSQLSLLRSRFSNLFGPEVLSEMELNTVDGFQGREVDILVVSTVRASDSSTKQCASNSASIGFVADVRRMNVALTRAKFSLWIVGNARTLQTNLHWAALIKNAKERKLFVSVSRPYSSIFKKDTLDSHSSQPMRSERGGHRGKVKHTDKNLDKSTRRLLRDSSLNNLQEICKKDESSKVVVGRPHENKKPRVQDEKSAISEGKFKRESVSKCVGDEINVDSPVSKDSNMKSLVKKAKRASKSSERSKSSSKWSQGDSSSALSCSTKGNNQKGEVVKSKTTVLGEQDHLIAARKRQREAVDSLLSSALISSKKPPSKQSSFKKQS